MRFSIFIRRRDTYFASYFAELLSSIHARRHASPAITPRWPEAMLRHTRRRDIIYAMMSRTFRRIAFLYHVDDALYQHAPEAGHFTPRFKETLLSP